MPSRYLNWEQIPGLRSIQKRVKASLQPIRYPWLTVYARQNVYTDYYVFCSLLGLVTLDQSLLAPAPIRSVVGRWCCDETSSDAACLSGTDTVGRRGWESRTTSEKAPEIYCPTDCLRIENSRAVGPAPWCGSAAPKARFTRQNDN